MVKVALVGEDMLVEHTEVASSLQAAASVVAQVYLESLVDEQDTAMEHRIQEDPGHLELQVSVEQQFAAREPLLTEVHTEFSFPPGFRMQLEVRGSQILPQGKSMLA